MLDQNELDEYLTPLTPDQVDAINTVRQLIFTHSPTLVEDIDTGKWFGGLLTYHTEKGVFVYALGPRKGGFTTFHMMPYYGSKTLQERHGPALKKVLSGKSCIKFKKYSDVPEEALTDILRSANSVMMSLNLKPTRKVDPQGDTASNEEQP